MYIKPLTGKHTLLHLTEIPPLNAPYWNTELTLVLSGLFAHFLWKGAITETNSNSLDCDIRYDYDLHVSRKVNWIQNIVTCYLVTRQ
jgi:hypothetical protein